MWDAGLEIGWWCGAAWSTLQSDSKLHLTCLSDSPQEWTGGSWVHLHTTWGSAPMQWYRAWKIRICLLTVATFSPNLRKTEMRARKWVYGCAWHHHTYPWDGWRRVGLGGGRVRPSTIKILNNGCGTSGTSNNTWHPRTGVGGRPVGGSRQLTILRTRGLQGCSTGRGTLASITKKAPFHRSNDQMNLLAAAGGSLNADPDNCNRPRPYFGLLPFGPLDSIEF